MKTNYDLENFLKLCRKAQELIFDCLQEEKTSHFFVVCGLEDYLTKLSPIEQIFAVGNYVNCITKKNFYIEIEPQKEIIIADTSKRYKADFYVDYYIGSDNNGGIKEYCLDKPIIVELDGKEYHSSKAQMNYDYERENDLKLAGYDIVRFTGSQIYNDVYSCLDKVCELIKKANKTEIW